MKHGPRVTAARVTAALAALVGCLVGCDHATKVVAQAALRDHAPVILVPGVIDLSYTENRDVAFSALSRLSLDAPAWALSAFAMGATVAIFGAWLRRNDRTWAEHAGFAMIVAGAIGNAADRLVSGHVVDFIHIHFWPVFNVADALIVAGAAVLIGAIGAPGRARARSGVRSSRGTPRG